MQTIRSHKKSAVKPIPFYKKDVVDVGREIAHRIFVSIQKSLGSDTLESVHRVSWRCYSIALFVALSIFSFSSLSFSAQTEVPATPVKTVVKSSAAPTVAKTSATKPADAVPVKKTLEKIKGEVVSVSPTSVAVFYETKDNNEYEKLIPFNPEMKLEVYKKTTDILKGDLVELHYEKVVEAEGLPNQRSTMTLKKLRFIKRPLKSIFTVEEKQV